MPPIEGVITAMATPFDADGRLDEPATRRLARHLAEHGSNGIVAAGSTGEAATLSDAEKLRVMALVREELGEDFLLICGTGSNDTRHSCELTKAAADAGADAALVVTPYYNKPNEAGLRAHFETVAEAAPDLPQILYNIPSRSVVNVEPELLAELATVDNIVAVKQANNAQIGLIEGMILLAGNDDVFLRTFELGGAGGILVASHVVGDGMREVWEATKAGDAARAKQIDVGLRGVYEAMSVTNPIPLKAALDMLGICSATMRLPMTQADESQRAQVRSALDRAGALSGAGR